MAGVDNARLVEVLQDDRLSWYLPLAVDALGDRLDADNIGSLLDLLAADKVTPLGRDPEDTADRLDAILGECPDHVRVLTTGHEDWPLIAIEDWRD